MTSIEEPGPLAQQFAQVREGLNVGPLPVGRREREQLDAAADALSAIERHVQDMETALGDIRRKAALSVKGGVAVQIVDLVDAALSVSRTSGVSEGEAREY